MIVENKRTFVLYSQPLICITNEFIMQR
jgi:hypothetical protein